MAGLRNTFTKALYPISKLMPLELLIGITKKNVIVPVYHTISDENPEHISHLYPVKTVKQFEADLEFLLKHYRPIDFRDLKKSIEGKKTNSKSFLLTFDDGLSEFYDIIAPILKKKGVPAVCFLNSSFMDNKELFFRYKASLLIGALKKSNRISSNEKVKQWFAKHSGNQDELGKTLLTISYKGKNELDELAKVMEFDFDSYLKEHKPYLTTGQIETLINQGFHFGAHSADHPEYRFISLDEQIAQTEESVSFICSRFSLDYKLFAFPFTDFQVPRKFFEEIQKRKLVDLSFGCAGLKQDIFPWHLQRIPLEMAHLHAQDILHSEYLYFMLKAPLGKNKITRS